jgi:DNA-binding MarR family transcriptional regulator
MRHFEKLRALRAFEKQQLDFLSTVEDHRLIGEIGYHQAKGKPLTLKQLSLLDVGSIATVQRRLRRLKQLGLVQHRRAASDRRAVELTLSPKCLRIFAKYDTLMSSKPPPRGTARRNGAPKHVCGLCDSDAGGRNLLVTFLAQGLKRGDKCVLVAPAEVQNDILAGLPHRRRAPERLVVSQGYDSADAQLAFFNCVLQEAKQTGQALCVAGDMSWTLSRNVRIDALLDIETRFEALARQLPLTGLCVYNARHFSSGDFLRAVKCHRDHSRHPIVLG